MANKKHYLIVSLTLGVIAASSAVLIGLTNLVTKDRIIQNENEKINKGIRQIFGDDAVFSKDPKESKEIKGYDYVKYFYTIIDDSDACLGYALRTTGFNAYGKVSLIVGFNCDNLAFAGTYTIVNEQTYASTLNENYLIPLNDGERQLDDVSCGATYGAKLVRDMVKEAQNAINDIKGN